MNRMTAVLAFALTIAPVSVQAESLVCRWQQKQQCEPGSACGALDATKMFVRVDPASGTYERCDSRGCDAYTASFTKSGAYTIIDLPGRGMFAKMGPGGSATEVVSLGHSVLISQGRCAAN